MKIQLHFILLSIILLFANCNQNEEEKLHKILNAKEIDIQRNTYGGLAGYTEQYFYLKKDQSQALLVMDKGSSNEKIIRLKPTNLLFESFLKRAFKSHHPQKVMSNSCLTGVDCEYIFSTGTSLKLKPDQQSDSLFDQIITNEQIR